MHPAFSVIFFTTLSGAGYGLWFWYAVSVLAGAPLPRTAALATLALGFALTSVGLLSSLLHLGQPQRAWRAFSQWRTSWLSREGVLAMACLLPLAACAWALWRGDDARVAAALLALLSLATVACTAMIYASLKPIPAWRHPLVLPVYLAFAAFSGGLLLTVVQACAQAPRSELAGLLGVMGAVALWRFKRRYWADLDLGQGPASRASALGLPQERGVRVFERPHTEANYLTREMGFVLARKHARKLRLIAVVLFAGVPALCLLPVWLLVHVDAAPFLAVASLSTLLGAVVERWLFFAEAKHAVMRYY